MSNDPDGVILDRRVMDGDLRYHLMLEMDNVKERLAKIETRHQSFEVKMDEVLTILKGSKLLAKFISWLGGIAVALAAIWTAMHSGLVK